MLPSSTEAVIVGGGILGTSAAAFLAGLGVDVVLLEQKFIASGSTGLAAGIITRQLWHPLDVRLVERSTAVYEALARKGGTDSIRRTGLLTLAGTKTSASRLEKLAAMQRRAGAPTRLLEPPEVAALAPAITTDDVVLASYLDSDAYGDPAQLCAGLAWRAKGAGARVEEVETARPVIRSGVVAGVRLDGGREIRCGILLLACGPWSPELLRRCRLPLPLKPYRTQVAVMGWRDGPPTVIPVHDTVQGIYFRPETGAQVLAGDGTEERATTPSTFRRGPDSGFIESLSERLVRRLPAAATAEYRGGWAGLCVATPDRHPLAGADWRVKGLYHLSGCNGFGFMRGPALGEAVAHIIEGRKPPLDVSEYSPERFGGWSRKRMAGFRIRQGFTL